MWNTVRENTAKTLVCLRKTTKHTAEKNEEKAKNTVCFLGHHTKAFSTLILNIKRD